MTLHLLYRSTGSTNRKSRPDWFDKTVSLASALRAAQACPGPVHLTFVNDGPMPTERVQLMSAWGEVVSLPGVGNSRSYRHAYRLASASAWPDDHLVYLCEDDYLHAPDAFRALVAVAEALPTASFFTLYDHPDLYEVPPAATIRVAAGRHWRTAPSTCMTFGARLGALRRQRLIHWAGTVPRTPRDTAIWRAVQRVGVFRVLPGRRHELVSPMPSLATHVEEPFLAPLVDWRSLAAETKAWARARGMPVAGADERAV